MHIHNTMATEIVSCSMHTKKMRLSTFATKDLQVPQTNYQSHSPSNNNNYYSILIFFNQLQYSNRSLVVGSVPLCRERDHAGRAHVAHTQHTCTHTHAFKNLASAGH